MDGKWIDQMMQEDGQNFLTEEYVLRKCQEIFCEYLGELQNIGSIASDNINRPIFAVNEAIANIDRARRK